MGHINIDGREIEYSVRHSARAKNLVLKINMVSGLEVVLPKGFKMSGLDSFMKSKADWIIAKLDYYEAVKEKRRNACESSKALFLGREYDITKIIRHGSSSRVRLIDDRLLAILPDDSRETLTRAMETWYRSQAADILKERAGLISSRLNLKYNRIFVKNQKTRWGSCSRLRNLNFNWRLIMAPIQVIDYIVVHEIAHLAEMNHSDRFWRLVGHACPDYKARRKWLRENGPLLSL